jgi:putative ABC transport system permease protein
LTELIWANFRARPVRTLLSVSAVALQVFLLLFMMGLTNGLIREWRERVQGIGADILVQRAEASVFFALEPVTLRQRMARDIRRVPGVRVVSPAIAVPNNRGVSVIYAVDFETFHQIGDGFRFVDGGPFEDDFDVIIDDIKAYGDNLQIGDAVKLFDQQWRVSGIVERGRGARFFIPLATAQRLLEVPGLVSMFWVETEEPGLMDEVREGILQVVPKHTVRRMDEFLSLMMPSKLPLVEPFTNSIIIIGVLITFLVVLLSMYTIVLERTREIGILKSLGASRWDVVSLMVREALLIGVLGIIVGVAASFGFREIFLASRPTATVDITREWILQGSVLALLGCTLGSLYPALRASAMEAIDALGYN